MKYETLRKEPCCTVAELRKFLEPYSDEARLVAEIPFNFGIQASYGMDHQSGEGFIAIEPMSKHGEDKKIACAVDLAKAAMDDLLARDSRIKYLEELINTPEIEDFMKAVPLEAGHQIERWGPDHDKSKNAYDWFWTLGYLAQKISQNIIAGDPDKARHHCITTAALCLNWHKQITEQLNQSGDKNVR